MINVFSREIESIENNESREKKRREDKGRDEEREKIQKDISYSLRNLFFSLSNLSYFEAFNRDHRNGENVTILLNTDRDTKVSDRYRSNANL